MAEKHALPSSVFGPMAELKRGHHNRN